MKRLTTAPNLALATLWADLLTHAGVPTTVQRAYASSIAGEVPPDQTLPELWVMDDGAVRRGAATCSSNCAIRRTGTGPAPAARDDRRPVRAVLELRAVDAGDEAAGPQGHAEQRSASGMRHPREPSP